MNNPVRWTLRLLAITLTAIGAAGPAGSQPYGKGYEKHGRSDRAEERRDDRREDRREDRRDDRRDDRGHGATARLAPGPGVYFADRHRLHIREYYGTVQQRGHCPPGLAKRNNGCMPPGQARHWQMGRPLPRTVIYYDVPQPLVVQLGIPPAGYRYVRVAADILLIAIGTGIVIDAIQDLGR